MLQTANRFDSAVQVWLTGYEMVGVALGLLIASQACRGYRRNESPPMLSMSLPFPTLRPTGRSPPSEITP